MTPDFFSERNFTNFSIFWDCFYFIYFLVVARNSQRSTAALSWLDGKHLHSLVNLQGNIFCQRKSVSQELQP